MKKWPIRGSRGLYALGAIAAVMAAGSAVAAESGALEEVVVTAEKRTANVQTTPIAITAVGAEQLDKMAANGLGDLQAVVPSMQFSTQSADAVRVQLTIRGIGSDVIEAGADAGVGLYLDGVYMGRTSAALTSIFDLDRVEVLRGPQGTLYGRNTSGGAVNLITKAPMSKSEAYGEVSGGDYGEYSLKGVVNGALSDTVSARFSFGGEHRNGYQQNLVPGGTSADDSKTGFGRLQLLFAPSEIFDFLGSAYYDKIGGVGPGTKAFGGVPPVFATGVLPDGTPNLSGVVNPSVFALAQPFPSDYHTVYKDTRESVDVPMYGVTGTAQWKLEAATLKSITSYQDTTQDEVRDLDATELPMAVLDRHEAATQFTQELNAGSRGTGPAQWLLGAFYFREQVKDLLTIIGQGGYVGFGGPGGGLDQTVNGHVTTESYALFGQASYEFSPRFKVTGGLRYTDEKRSMVTSAGFVDRVNGALLLGGGLTTRPSLDVAKSWQPLTWKLGVDSQLTDNVFAYAAASNAFKSGGFNLGNPLAGSFEPEKMTAYELGLKVRGFDQRLQLNFAAFHYDVKAMQLEVFGLGGPEIVNATGGKVDGVELESVAALPGGLRLSANLGWLHTQFDKGFQAVDPAQLTLLGPNPPLVNLGGNSFPRAPEMTASIDLDYRHAVGAGQVAVGATYSYQDKVYFRIFNDQTPYRSQPAYATLNVRSGYEWANGSWSLMAHVKNVTNKDYISNDFVPPILLGAEDIATVGAPRTILVVLKHRFL